MRGERNKNNDKGFTLVEAVVSMLILTIVILSIIGGFNIITNSNYKAKKIQGANTLFSDINEKLRDATDYDEAKEIVDNEINGKEFSVGALKYEVEATLSATGGVPYATAAPTEVPGADYSVGRLTLGWYSYRCYFSPAENNYYVIDGYDKKYFSVSSTGKYTVTVDGATYILNSPTPTPTPAPTAVLVKSIDNYAYELNQESNPGFPEFDDKKVKAIVLDNTDIDALNNEYTSDEIDYLERVDDENYSALGVRSLTSSLRSVGALGRVNDKQITYKFKKVWYLNTADKTGGTNGTTYVKYIIASSISYNKGKDSYSSDNFWGYGSITNNEDVYLDNGTRYPNSTWVRRLQFFRYFISTVGLENENDLGVIARYSDCLTGINGGSVQKRIRSSLTTARYLTDEYMFYGDEANYPVIGAGVPEVVLAEGRADKWSNTYGPQSTEAEKQLAELDSIYLFYTPYSEDPDSVKLTDERYLTMNLYMDDTWDFKKQYNVYFLVSNRDATDITASSKGYLMKYWRLVSEEARKEFYPLGNAGLITNVRYHGEGSEVVTSSHSFSRFTGINYAEKSNYNKNFKIVPDTVAHSDVPTKTTGVDIKIKFNGETILEKDWYLYFK